MRLKEAAASSRRPPRAIAEEERLKRRYRTLYERMPVMMHSIDRHGRLVSVSDLWLRALGYTRREVIGRKSVEFLTPESAKYAREVILPEYFKTGVCTDVPYQMVKKDGGIIDILLSASAERGPGGAFERSLAVLRDVTERKRLEQEILDVGAQEQSRLGRELHDGVGQDLTGISLMARSLLRELARGGGRHAEQARRIAEAAAAAVEQVRALAAGLLPSELVPNGLPEGLRKLCARVERLFGLSCTALCPARLPKLPDVALVHLYRIAQESLTNAAKHAGARRAALTLSVKGRRLSLRVEDDGKGFDPAAATDGLGLKIMRHRARMLGGSLEVRRGRLGGTAVVSSCPIPRRA